MKDLKLHETCNNCKKNLALRESISYPSSELWLVKYCPSCGSHPVQEVIRLYVAKAGDTNV